MNNLSWFLYLADVVDKLGAMAWTFFGLASLGTLFVGVGRIISHSESTTYNLEDGFKAATNTLAWVLPVVMGFSLLIGILAPSKQTLYAMAASEVAEDALESPVAKKAVAALERYLDTVATKTNDN